MQLNKAVSYRLTQLLAERNMTAYMLYTRTGVAKSTIYNALASRGESLNLRTLHIICQGFGISLGEFFDSPLFANENLDP